MKDTVHELAGRLEAKGPDDQSWYTAHCPFHNDQHPSLRFNHHGFRCMGCGEKGNLKKLADKLGIDVPPSQIKGLTLTDLAIDKGIAEFFLADLGITDGFIGSSNNRRPCVDITYMDESHQVRAIQKRLSSADSPRFIWRRGDHPIPYGLWKLMEIRSAGFVIIVEGASDCWTLWFHGIPALGLPGASTWKPEYARLLEGVEAYLWIESDSGGQTFLQSVSQTLPDIKTILAPEHAKDPSALYLYNKQAFVSSFQCLMADAIRISDLQALQQSEDTIRLYDKVKHLAEDPHLIQRLIHTIKECGYAGDVRPALCAYIALTSRLLHKPLNIIFVAQSGSGKNASIEAVLPLFLEDIYYMVRASSQKALIYANQDFQHRIVILWEADSIPEEGPAASAIRSLMSDQRLEYDVVEKDNSGKHIVRHIRKDGPTGIITTSTKPLREQASTRMLTVSIADTPDQTRAVLQAIAQETETNPELVNEISAWIDFQQWLNVSGVQDVSVPFAQALAEKFPVDAVRIRRDFSQILSVIKTFALIHQAQRQRDNKGRSIASLDDYRLTCWLLEDVLSTTVTGGASSAIRETVQAVNELYQPEKPVSLPMLMDHLGLARSSISYRVSRAIAGGWLVNLSKQKGMPAQLKAGLPLPDRSFLPDADALVCSIPPENRSNTRTPQSNQPVSKLNSGQEVFEYPFEHHQPFEHLFEQSRESKFVAKNANSDTGVRMFESNKEDCTHTRDHETDVSKQWSLEI